jgi:hypothetical protein
MSMRWRAIGAQGKWKKRYWIYDFHSETDEYVRDSHGIQYLVGRYWGYYDMLASPTEISLSGRYGEEAINELKKGIASEARKWVERYCAATNQEAR